MLGAVVNVIVLSVIYEFLQSARVFVPGKPFQLSLMFAGKARAYPSTLYLLHSSVESCPYPQAETGLEKLDRDKTCLRKFVNYGQTLL